MGYSIAEVREVLRNWYGTAGTVEEADMRADVASALAHLPARHRAVLLLAAAGYTEREVGRHLGVSTKTLVERAEVALMEELNRGV